MKKNLYYRTLLRRENVLQIVVLTIFKFCASYPRLLLEVFIRKNFGERYFKLPSALTVAVLLALYPYARNFFNSGYGSSIMPHYLTWYIFLVLFVLISIKHHWDMRRNPSVFDFKKFSLCSGDINPVFYRINLPDKKTDTRRVECLLEPAVFFMAGLLLYFIGQKLGNLLIVCSVIYSLSYVANYVEGDNFVMDKIDEMICNEELEKSFVDDVDEDETRGFSFRGKKPNDHDIRRKILPSMMDDEEIVEAK